MDLVTLATACMLHGSAVVAAPAAHCGPPIAKPAAHRGHLTGPLELGGRLAQWETFVGEAAQRFDLPPAWIRRVITVESGARTTLHGHPITSTAGAMGLMQLMPGTYDDMRRTFNLGNDPFDPRDNILAGAAYLRAMFDRFGSGAFAAYNAGPRRYRDYLNGRRLLPSETVSYLEKLNVPEAASSAKAPASVFIAPANELFFALSNQHSSASDSNVLDVVSKRLPKISTHAQENNLFIQLSTARR
jgi:soluble lytic murein transglycosylase-like protein